MDVGLGVLSCFVLVCCYVWSSGQMPGRQGTAFPLSNFASAGCTSSSCGSWVVVLGVYFGGLWLVWLIAGGLAFGIFGGFAA